MKAIPCPPLHFVRFVLIALVIPLLSTGCISNRYKKARKNLPAAELLNVPFAPAPLEASLNMVIVYNGPGSWKRDALWDEYAVTLHNPGAEPLTLTSSALADYAGLARPACDKPWILERESQTLEKKYKDMGMAFVRHAGATVTIVGVGAAGIASAGVFSASAPVIAGATIAALPLYALVVVTSNHDNRQLRELEFNRRCLRLPLTLAPGETRKGSFFFPMVPGPRSLSLHWSAGAAGGDAILALDFLRGLHLSSPVASATKGS
jgi:hypothetical protein